MFYTMSCDIIGKYLSLGNMLKEFHVDAGILRYEFSFLDDSLIPFIIVKLKSNLLQFAIFTLIVNFW